MKYSDYCKGSNSNPAYGPSACPFKAGDEITHAGSEFKVEVLGLKYYQTNGHPDTMYAQISRGDENFLVTYHKLQEFKLFKLEPKIVDLRVLMRAGPCYDGVEFIARVLKLPESAGVFDIGMYLGTSFTVEFRTTYLQEAYIELYGATPPTSWLGFVAKALGLVPEGPERDSTLRRKLLLRLLGISE